MKIVFVNRYFHPDISATSQLLTDLACHLAGRDLEVHVVCCRQLYGDPRANLPAHDEFRGVRVHRVPTTRFGRSRLPGRALDYATFYLSAAWALLCVTSKDDVVVAETDPPLISVVAALVAWYRRARLVNWLQDFFPEVAERIGLRMPLSWLARGLRNRSLRAASVNVAVGHGMARTISALAGHSVRVEVVENWADGAQVRPIAPDENPLRARWGLSDRFVVGYSGNMGRAHEFDTMIGAWEALRSDPGIVFLLIGSGRYHAELEREVTRRSLPNVRFLPYQPRESLALSLTTPDVHLVTLRPELEGLIVPSKFYGIAAAGRPTIFIGDCAGEIARIVEREGCGMAVQAGDVPALVEAIVALRDDPQWACAAGRRARKTFEQQFDLPVAMTHWDSVLRRHCGPSADQLL